MQIDISCSPRRSPGYGAAVLNYVVSAFNSPGLLFLFNHQEDHHAVMALPSHPHILFCGLDAYSTIILDVSTANLLRTLPQVYLMATAEMTQVST